MMPAVYVGSKSRWIKRRVDKRIVCEVSSPCNALDLVLFGKGAVILPGFIGDSQSVLHRTGEPIDELVRKQWIEPGRGLR
ncbi:MAG: hypothetical protein V3U76_14480 [Granulosicoccus sp.]